MFEEVKGRLKEIKSINKQVSNARNYITTRLLISEIPYVKNVNISLGKLGVVDTIREGEYLLAEVIDIVSSHRLSKEINEIRDRKEREEILRKIEESFSRIDSENVWLDVYMVPTNYLVKIENGIMRIKKGYEPPVIGSEVRFLNDDSYVNLVGSKNGVRLGKIINTNRYLPIDIVRMIKYHIGVFGFTGTGKSNLVSILTRKILSNVENSKVVIFDVSLEYSILLLDLIFKENSLVLTTDKIPKSSNEFGRRFLRTHVIPNELIDKRENIKSIAERLYHNKRIRRIETPIIEEKYMSYRSLIKLIREQLEERYFSTSYKPILYLFLKKLEEFMIKKNLSSDDIVDESINEFLEEMEYIIKGANIRENSAIFTFLSTLKSYASLSLSTVEDENLIDIESLAIQLIENNQESPKIVVIESSSLEDARLIAYNLINEVFRRKKKSYSTTQIIFVFDEAQEFIPYDFRGREGSELSSVAIENLLRHGRKYYMNSIISTQRLAYLNTNVLQQLHTYFVGTLPRPYDRQLIADTFGVSEDIVEKTLSLEVGQWLLLTFKSALPHDIPLFIEIENNLDELKKNLENI